MYAATRSMKASSCRLKQEKIEQNEVKDSWEELADDDFVCGNQFKIITIAEEGESSKNDERGEGGIDYPLDLWFLISEYIRPEAVGKFACICRSSYYVTTTSKFWFHLYKSYYTYKPGLPIRLQPQCMVRTHGLRACVIRMLYHTYFKSKTEMFNTPHSLVKRRCCVMWHQKRIGEWLFFFKLKEVPESCDKSLAEKTDIHSKRIDFLEMLEDIAVNPEEGCKLLVVMSRKYSMLPPVIGLILQKVSLTLMPNYGRYRLQLNFGTSDVPNTLTHQVVVTDVVCCYVLNWWHRFYPHEDGFFI